MHHTARAMDIQVPLCGGSGSISHGFMARFGGKCLLMLLYTLTRGIWEALVSTHPHPIPAIVCCLYYSDPTNVQCILELYCAVQIIKQDK